MSLKEKVLLRRIVYLWRNFQDKHSYVKGQNNRVSTNRAVRINSRVQITGDGNIVILERGSVLKNSLIKIQGNNNKIVLREGSFVSGAELWVENNGCLIEIGQKTFIGHHSHLACTENGSELFIGKDGLVSSYVQIRTGDSHSIYDMSGNRINDAQSIKIGNHVWIGEGAKILKGVSLEENVVVSTGAIVTRSFSKNLLIGGVPAKVLKEGVSWDKNRV